MTELETRLRGHLNRTADGLQPPPLDVDSPARRAGQRRRHRLLGALGAVVLVVGGIGVGVSLLGQEDDDMREVEVVDDPTPSLTVKPTPTPTTTSPEDGDASPEATGDLAWSEFALPGSDGGAQTTISWAGSTFARTGHPGCCPQLELSPDGRSWSRVTDLPDAIGGAFGELSGIAGWGDELVIWGAEHRNDGSRPVVATSVDGGASWTERDGLEPGTPDLAYATHTTRVVEAAVKGGTVVALTETTVSFDLVGAMQDAGLPVGPIDHATLQPGSATVEWIDGDPDGTYVQYCVDVSCSSTQRIPLGELGIDTDRLPLRQRTVLAHRADASGGFASIDLDTDLDDGLGVLVVDDTFVMIDHAAFRDATVMSSPDGVRWTATAMGGTYPAMLATDGEHLFALDPDSELRRSGDLGLSWEVVGLVDPDIEIVDVDAGRAGVVLLGVRREDGTEVLAWSRDGTAFDFRSLPDALQIDGGRSVNEIGESLITPGERLVTQDSGWSPSLALGDTTVVVGMAVSDPLRDVSRDEDGGEAAAWVGIPDPEDPTVQFGAAVRPRLFVADVG